MTRVRRIPPESPARLATLESLYDAGRLAEAAALGEQMVGQPCSASSHARTQFHLAMTYLRLGKPDLGQQPLAEAKRYFEAVDDAVMVVECMASEATVACFYQRPDALGLARKALAACRSLREVPSALELRTLGGVASAQLMAGQTREAAMTFEEAIRRADPVVDMRQLGRMLGNAGIAYRELGQLDRAVSCSKRAVALFETLRDLVSLAREENNLGCYLIGRGELVSARNHLERSLRLFEETELLMGRSLMLLSLCELCLAEGNVEQAMDHADAALEVAESQNETWSIADSRMWKGRIAARLGDDAAADEEFRRALAVLADAGMAERLVECHIAYAEVLNRRGDLPAAYEHLKLAFRIKAS